MPGFDEQFSILLIQAAGLVDPELAYFSFTGNSTVKDELTTQYLTYIYSCAASSVLRHSGFAPIMDAGYSMGIYACLFDAGSVSFETGLEMITIAYHSLVASMNNRLFGMGTLIGPDGRDIQQLIDQFCLRIQITNQNAVHSFVVSGYRDDLHKLMEMAMEEGALHTRTLGVSVPYHAGYLDEGAMNFNRKVSHLHIDAPATPIISLIDQVMLSTPQLVRREITRNLHNPLNWLGTMQLMLGLGVTQFIECGPSKGLARNARFIGGNFRFDTLNSIQ